MVIGDPYRVENILIQLVSNAVQYTDAGYISFEMTPSNYDDKNIVISSKVQDTGIGIPEKKQDKIYEMFEKCKPSYTGHTNNIGIGLSIVKQFVHDLEGNIILDSRLNEGSLFDILLPFEVPIGQQDKSNA